ncbi:MAG: Rieske (2Fe-2S) protein, partial [Casimicrobiaceae bacterium]|nr:Rieske (2Fe-2S) protein [Casimicrobiaceae bacterium]
MSRLLSAAELAVPTSQLPPSVYFDAALFERERELLFARGPGYVGHERMVPEVGDYFVLDARNEAQMLTRTERGVHLISNLCRHRQAVMLKGRGSLNSTGGTIVCPLHRWTYSAEGELLGAPHFPCNPSLSLENRPLKRWNGLLF